MTAARQAKKTQLKRDAQDADIKVGGGRDRSQQDIAARAGGGLQSVDRTLRVLAAIAEEPERRWTLSDLSRCVGLHKTTTYRMLNALARHGYVEREGARGVYQLGPAALLLGAASQSRLRRVAHPALRKLTETTGETSLLHVRVGTETMCIDKVESPRPVRVTYDIGRRGPLYAGSSGKTLLAFLEVDEQEELLSTLELKAYTALTITDAANLRTNLAQIREQGYVQTFGELDEGVYGVGAPIWNPQGLLEGGVTLVAPAARCTEDRWPAMIEGTIQAAHRISMQLGYVPKGRVTDT